jgi:hypothetical protein
MAIRTFFVPRNDYPFYSELTINFDFYKGLSISQQQKTITSMHNAIFNQSSHYNLLEISTKSTHPYGLKLSAFNLPFWYESKNCILESVYQSCKNFEDGGPYLDLAFMEAIRAKKDLRLKNSGKLLNYYFDSKIWPLLPSPNFYDFLYTSAFLDNFRIESLLEFNAFTDFAYSATDKSRKKMRSFNCQARSAAIIVGLSSSLEVQEIRQKLESLASDETRLVEKRELTLFED